MFLIPNEKRQKKLNSERLWFYYPYNRHYEHLVYVSATL